MNKLHVLSKVLICFRRKFHIAFGQHKLSNFFQLLRRVIFKFQHFIETGIKSWVRIQSYIIVSAALWRDLHVVQAGTGFG